MRSNPDNRRGSHRARNDAAPGRSRLLRRFVPLAAVILLLGGAAVYLLANQRDEAPPPTNLIAGPPPVAFEPASFDFGEMPLRTTRTETVLMRNTGSAPLHVRSARGSCACLRADLGPVIIRPGSGVSVPLQMNSLGTPGDVTYTLSVMFAGYEDPAVLNVRRITLDE